MISTGDIMRANLEKDKRVYAHIQKGYFYIDHLWPQIYDYRFRKYLNNMSEYPGRNSYVHVYITFDEGDTCIMLLHRFIWIFCNGLIPYGLIINHINGNKQDNLLCNLELVTNAQNVKHAYDIGLAKVSDYAREQSSKRWIGSNNVNAKMTESQVSEYRRKYYNGFMTKKEIIEDSGVSRRAIGNMLKGDTYAHVL